MVRLAGWTRWLTLCALVACGDDVGWEPGPLGTLAYVNRASPGALVVQDVQSGEVRVIDEAVNRGPSAATFASVSLSPDARRVAYVREGNFEQSTQLRIADIAGESITEIGPDIDDALFDLQWERAGWMLYATGSASSYEWMMLLPGQDTGRTIGTGRVSVLLESPTDDRIAYTDCSAVVEDRCVYDIIEESPDGADSRLIVSGVSMAAMAYTPDGTGLITFEWAGDEHHARVRPLDGSAPIDLGAMGNLISNRVWLDGAASLFSPNGNEILLVRDRVVEAERLDGSGRRLIVDLPVYRAAFTPSGAVVYATSRNIEEPPDDTPELGYSTFAVLPSGDVVTLRLDDPNCRAHMVSPDGELVAFSCYGTPVHRISDGGLVVETPGYAPVGFTPDGTGIIVADSFEPFGLWLAPFVGEPNRLGNHLATTRPYYDYEP